MITRTKNLLVILYEWLLKSNNFLKYLCLYFTSIGLALLIYSNRLLSKNVCEMENGKI